MSNLIIGSVSVKEYIQNYEKWLKEILKQELNNDEANKLANYHKTQIQFLQHERFVHLIVMVMTIILFFITFFIFYNNVSLPLGLLMFILGVLSVAYIIHYYRLENTVQKWYKIYNSLVIREDRLG